MDSAKNALLIMLKLHTLKEDLYNAWLKTVAII